DPGDGGRERSRGRLEAERRADADVELTREVPRHDDARPRAHRRERRLRITGGELEVVHALGREGALVERVDADPDAAVIVLGETNALDACDARDGSEPLAHSLVDGRLDPA